MAVSHRRARPPFPQQHTLAAAVSLALASLPAFAQSAPEADKKVTAQALPAVVVKGQAETPPYKADTVSSPKFTQPLVDTPQTITVIKKEILLEQGATTLSEALRNTPGITFQAGENGNTATGDSVFMRGFDSQGSIFVDGIRDLGSIARDVFNIDQIEVAKGATGADIGRTAAGGYINLVSKVPQAEDFVSGSTTVGTGDKKRATVDLNQALPIDGAAVRLNAMWENSGVDGRDYIRNKRWGIAPSVAFGLNTPTRTYLNYLHIDQNNRPDGGVPTIGLKGYYNPAFDASSTPSFPSGGPNAGVTPRAVDSENYYGALSDYDHIQADMFTARLEHDFAPGVTLRNTTRYGKLKQQYELTGVNAVTVTDSDPDNWTVARTRQGKDQVNEIFTNQTHLNATFSTGAIQHSLVTGVEFIYEKQSNVTLAAASGTTAANLYNPSLSDTFTPLLPTGAHSKGSTMTIGAYAFDTLKIGDRWQLNGGLRLDHYKTEYDATVVSTATTHPSLPVGTLVPQSLENSDNLLTWKIGALYKPATNGSIYAAYLVSQQPPGGSNFTLSTTATNINSPNLDPQIARTVELGTKWDVLDNKLALTAAIFRTTSKNDLAIESTPGEITQYGERRVQGIELGAVGQITPNWQVSTGLARTDYDVTEGTTTCSSSTSCNLTNGGTIVFSPKLTFTAWTTYKLPFGLTIGGGARYVDSVVRSSGTVFYSGTTPITPTGLLKAEDYWVFDAMASYELTKNVSLQLNLYNLFDKHYIAKLNNGGTRYYPGAPRTAQLTANFKF